MTKTPKKFACGIDVYGPADLVTLVKDFPPYWKNWMHMWYRYVGNPNNPTDLQAIRKKSPINYIERIKSPLLIIQGENDVRVRRNQSERMVEKMRQAGKQVEYVLIKGEGHSFRHWKNRLKLYRLTEDYLAKCLGGRSSGFDFYQLGSWMF
jgi:dipeptidyl aminopeptidase/acylaminoacyl peptidase